MVRETPAEQMSDSPPGSPVVPRRLKFAPIVQSAEKDESEQLLSQSDNDSDDEEIRGLGLQARDSMEPFFNPYPDSLLTTDAREKEDNVIMTFFPELGLRRHFLHYHAEHLCSSCLTRVVGALSSGCMDPTMAVRCKQKCIDLLWLKYRCVIHKDL